MGATSRFRALCWECDLTGYAFGRGLAEARHRASSGRLPSGHHHPHGRVGGSWTLRGWRLKKLVELIDAAEVLEQHVALPGRHLAGCVVRPQVTRGPLTRGHPGDHLGQFAGELSGTFDP